MPVWRCFIVKRNCSLFSHSLVLNVRWQIAHVRLPPSVLGHTACHASVHPNLQVWCALTLPSPRLSFFRFTSDVSDSRTPLLEVSRPPAVLSGRDCRQIRLCRLHNFSDGAEELSFLSSSVKWPRNESRMSVSLIETIVVHSWTVFCRVCIFVVVVDNEISGYLHTEINSNSRCILIKCSELYRSAACC